MKKGGNKRCRAEKRSSVLLNKNLVFALILLSWSKSFEILYELVIICKLLTYQRAHEAKKSNFHYKAGLGWKLLTNFEKSFLLDVWPGSECPFAIWLLINVITYRIIVDNTEHGLMYTALCQ